MAERPLLALPSPQAGAAPPGHGGAARLRLPTNAQQISTYGPVFKRLREALARRGGVMTLRDDRAAPEGGSAPVSFPLPSIR
jgi:hypothetical protein